MTNKIKRRIRKTAKLLRMVYKMISQKIKPSPKRNQLVSFLKVLFYFII